MTATHQSRFSKAWATTAADVPPKCKQFRTSALGLQRRCCSCQEWWPADTDFFTRAAHAPGGLASLCKACAFDRSTTAANAGRLRPAITAPMQMLASVAWLRTYPPRSPS